jgi:hypothetical protein
MQRVHGQPLRELHVPTGPPPRDVVSASAAVRQAFGELAAGDVPEDLAFVQRGEGLGWCLEESRRRSPAGEVRGVVVDETLFLSEDTAAVRFTMHVGDRDFGPLDGRAVRVADSWLIERATFCELVRRVGVRCPPPR